MASAMPQRELGLILSYRCNLRCRYCPVCKGSETMQPTVLKKALELFGQHNPPKFIRFFGGDPLLALDLVRLAVHEANHIWPYPERLRFELTTNGLRLDDTILKYFQSESRLGVVVSLDGRKEDHERNRIALVEGESSFDFWPRYRDNILKLPGFRWINMVIAPDTASQAFDNFAFLVREGVRSFNFLPAYYQAWNDSQLQALRHGFDRIAAFLERATESGKPFYIRNLDVHLPHPLYREGRVVDTDGEVYDGDTITAEPFRSHRHRFSLGNVLDINHPDDLAQSPKWAWDDAHETLLAPEIRRSTALADEALGRFVERLEGNLKNR